MALVIKDAVKKHLRARIALLAPTGGGKTYSGLKFLGAMVKLGMAKKIGVIDTEHRSASKYIGEFPPFRVIEMEDDFSPEQYIEALSMLADDGCDGVLIDSLSHAWVGKGGSLELKDKFGKQKGLNDYTAWGPISSMQNRLIEAMLSYPGHLVATMRLKMEHVLEEDPITKKKVVRKIGLQPQQRDGLEYEFDLVGDLDQDHNFSVSKTRCSALDGYSVHKPGEEVIKKMKTWLESGTAEADRFVGKPAPAPAPVRQAAPASEVHPAATTTASPVVAPVAATIPATTTTAQTPRPAGETTGAPATTVEPPSSAEAAMRERPAVEFARQLEEAQSVAALSDIVGIIAIAVRSKIVDAAERKDLLARWSVANKKFEQRVAA
jgi:hypothetical protein